MRSASEEHKLCVQLDDIRCYYGKTLALQIESLSIESNQSIAIVGENGSGKTTFLKLLLGLLKPKHGQISYFNLEKDPRFRRKQLGYVLHELSLDKDLTVMENLSLVGRLYGLKKSVLMAQTQELMKIFEVFEFAQMNLKDLSFGNQKKIDLIRTLLYKPSLLFLDEVTVGLDVLSQAIFWRYLNAYQQENKSTLLYITHNFNELKYCGRVLAFSQNQLISDIQRSDLIKNAPLQILETPTDLDPKLLEALCEILKKPRLFQDKLIFLIDHFDEIHKPLFDIFIIHGHFDGYTLRKPSIPEMIELYQHKENV